MKPKLFTLLLEFGLSQSADGWALLAVMATFAVFVVDCKRQGVE